MDIYSRDEIVEGFNEDVHWHDAIPFDDLAEVLPRYDVGLILYKGHIPNYVHNVPNKFWEYLAAGLGGIVPSMMNFDLVPKSLRGRASTFDFVSWSSQEFEEKTHALLEVNREQDSVLSIECYLRELLVSLNREKLLD